MTLNNTNLWKLYKSNEHSRYKKYDIYRHIPPCTAENIQIPSPVNSWNKIWLVGEFWPPANQPTKT
jgi:hypothetical protein